MKHAAPLIEHFPTPIAVVKQNGEVVETNRAFLELAQQYRVGHNPAELFGAAFVRVLARAWIERHIQSTAQLIVGDEPRPAYRISFMTTGDDGTLGVTFQDISSELELRRMLAERDRDFAVLRDVGVTLSSLLDVESLALRTYEATQRVIACKSIYVAIFDRETNTIAFPRYMEDGEWKEMTSRPFSDGLTEHLLHTREPLLLNENVAERCQELGIDPKGRPCLAWMGAPMVVDDASVGVIGLQDYEKSGVYDQHDLEVLTIIAAQAAAGIRNAMAVTAERRAFREIADAQMRMLETERLRGVTETVGALNHEVNNPLAAIVGNSQLLLRRAEGLPIPVVQKIEAVHEAAKRIQRVTAKMASLIQACSVPYPGNQSIIDVHNSVSGDGADAPQPVEVGAAAQHAGAEAASPPPSTPAASDAIAESDPGPFHRPSMHRAETSEPSEPVASRSASAPHPESPPRPIPSRPVPSQPVPSRPVPSRPVPSRPIPSRPIPSRPIPSRPLAQDRPAGSPAPARPAAPRPVPSRPGPQAPKPRPH